MEKSKYPEIRIETRNARSKVTIDGQEIRGICDIRFSHKPLEAPILTLDILGMNLSFDGNFWPRLPEPFSKFYELKKPKYVESGEENQCDNAD